MNGEKQMNGGKNKFFYNSFTAYARAMFASPIGAKRETGFMVETFINIFSFIALFWVVGSFESVFGYVDVGANVVCASAMVGAFLYAVWISFGIARRAKPSPVGLLPISWKRRVIYDYLGNLVYSIFIAVCIAIFALLWTLLLGLLVLAATGEWIFQVVEDSGITVTAYASAQGNLFALFSGLLIYGAGACIANLTNKKWRIGLTLAFPFIIKLAGLLFLNCAVGGDFVMNGNIAFVFDELPISWLWLTVTALAAVGITVLSVFMCIKFQKPDKI